MADDKVTNDVQTKCSREKLLFLSSVILVFVIVNTVVFLALTIYQLSNIGEIERKLLGKRINIETLRASCRNNEYSKEKFLQLIDILPYVNQKYSGLGESLRKRQTASLATLFQDLVHAQEQLLLERCTPDTIICIKGLKGEHGLPGEKGDKGQIGSKGMSGYKGYDGEKGMPGEKGEKGIMGDKGDMGQRNVNGVKGDMGIAGDKGEAGIVGMKGEPGVNGVKGAPGDKGQAGPVGKPGLNGPKGTKGEPGTTGEKGVKGAIGDAGPRGNSGNRTNCDCMSKPKFYESSKTMAVHYGDNVTLDCSTATLPEATITWTKTDSDGCFANFSKTSGDKIELDRIQPVDIGTYQCSAENALGTAFKTIKLTTTDNPDVISCDFESGFCGWYQSKSDDADFSRNTGHLRTPTTDHTPGKGGNGYYVNIDSASMTTGQTSRLESFYVPAHEKHCLTFWYFVDGASGAILHVKAKACSMDEATLLKLTSSRMGWVQARVDIPVDIHGRQIVFEAKRGNSASDVAIDDVTLSNKECPPADKKPEILNKNTTIQRNLGERVELQCNVTGQPRPNITWLKESACSRFERNVQTLVLPNVTQAQAGTYKCVATNSIGRDEGQVKLVVNETQNCTFDTTTEICDWQNIAAGDDRDWMRQSGSTPSSSTGPSSDHTLGTTSGYYMYLEASSPVQVNDTAILQYKTLPSDQPFCLNFWYHMYGSTMGSLRIMAKDCVTNTRRELWKESGSKGDAWKNACLLVEQHSHDYNLQIEAVRGSNYHSDIGIDDVQVDTGTCACRKNIDIACDFEKDLCEGQGFASRHDSTYVLQWNRIKGVTPSVDTGPDHDHTTGSGYYIFVETSGGRAGLKGSFQSPELPARQEACLHFWYNMNGVDMGSLDVLIEPSNGGSANILHQTGNHGAKWIEARMTIPVQTHPYKIDFQPTRGASFHGDVALDDISIKDGPCS
ncbi:MAM and LDL-receptor class A domain-containing protein 1-like [Saccostrea echinata]|uniref:MAM and LDL-receptor class A domain-containing protein 1-like n=1 Tax=Saccostrea echinata TaxID=191078 RepID=UPI002A81474C|nr:MAM and LDL-receptor class A domain-containing protein 1-like [Saccostrea echinata]